MKTLRIYLLSLLLSASMVLVSCNDDDNKPKGEFASGTLVINEGNFLDADGTVSHISTSGEVTNDLFGSVNDGRALGDVVQSMTVAGDVGYVIVNNSNKVEVVNANTFEAQHTIDGLKLPRHFITHSGKGYVTEWVSFSSPGRVSVIDLQSHAVTKTITTDFGAEGIVAVNGKIYVSNNFTTTVSVINPPSAEVEKTIEVGNAPGAFAVDNQNMLWVICGGGYDANFNPLNDGKLVQINPSTNTVVKSIPLNANVSAKMAISKEKNALYYYKGKSVYVVSTTAAAGTSAAEILLTESAAVGFYGIGIDPKTNILYVADAKAFSGAGTVFTYSITGSLLTSYTVGRGPNGFVFR